MEYKELNDYIIDTNRNNIIYNYNILILKYGEKYFNSYNDNNYEEIKRKISNNNIKENNKINIIKKELLIFKI